MAEDPFLKMQNGYYNALAAGLGLSPSTFQILQPSPPVVSGANADQTLWAYLNNIPPFTLTQNYIASAGNQFFSNYKGVLSALESGPNNFEQVVGPVCFAEWRTYLRTLAPPPQSNQLPAMFFSWAFMYYPSVASSGASSLSQALLDPVTSAQIEMTWFYTPMPPAPPRSPDWSQTYTDLLAQLAGSPEVGFQASSSSWNSSVTNTWTKGTNSGFFGLWGGSSSSSETSQAFSASSISVDAKFGRVTTFSPTPGPWYGSSAMGLAYANKTGAPWNPKSAVNWDNTFGSNGNMQRFASSLVVVSGMKISVIATATFTEKQRAEINANKGAGLWPFYSSSSNAGSSTTATFDDQGRLTIQIMSEPGIPVVIGVNVVSAGAFVGHASEAASIRRAAALDERELAVR